MILRFALTLALIALADLLAATVFCELGVFVFVQTLFQLGEILLLSSFGLIVLLGSSLVARLTALSFFSYFSLHHRLERKLLFLHHQKNRIERLYRFRTAKLIYQSKLKRSRLFNKGERKSAPS